MGVVVPKLTAKLPNRAVPAPTVFPLDPHPPSSSVMPYPKALNGVATAARCEGAVTRTPYFIPRSGAQFPDTHISPWSQVAMSFGFGAGAMVRRAGAAPAGVVALPSPGAAPGMTLIRLGGASAVSTLPSTVMQCRAVKMTLLPEDV